MWSCRFFPTGRSATQAMSIARRCSAGPMPDSIRSCGELNVPLDTITSLAASARLRSPELSVYSTPVARVPFMSTRVACAPVSTVRFGRFFAGRR